MKKTQWIELFNRIKETIVSFIAILFFVCFGIALFVGIGWTKYTLEDTFENEFKQNNLHNYEVLSNYKFTSENIDELSNIFKNYEIEGSYSTFEGFDYNTSKLYAKIVGITDNIDKLFLIEGELPKKDNEIVLESNYAKVTKTEIGDHIKFDLNSNLPILKNNEFIVTGFAESPAYISHLAPNYEISTNGGNSTTCIMFVSRDVFNETILPGYNELFIRVNELDEFPTLSDEYIDKSKEIEDKIDKEISKVIDDNYTIIPRKDNGSIFAANIITDLCSKLKYNFASMFIIIGFMICYSTISRLVYIDIKRIGTKEALGFYTKEITKSYLFYILIVSTLGCVLGILLGRFIIEPFFISIMSGTFIIDSVTYSFSTKEILIISSLEIGVMVIICLLSCRSILKKDLRSLLQGYEIPEVKASILEKTKLWNKLSLLTKCILNNFVYDKRRVIATLIGITGCTALLVSAISFQSSISGTTDRQFELQKYNCVVSYDYRNESAEENIEKFLTDNAYQFEKASLTNISLIEKDGNAMVSRMLIGDDADFNGLIDFNSDGIKQTPEHDAWISVGYAEEYNYNVGDYIEVNDSNSEKHKIRVGGIFEFYQQVPYLIMSKETYKDIYNKLPQNNIYLVRNNDVFDMFKEKVMEIDGVIGARNGYANFVKTQSIIITISTAITAIYILLSVVIALCIILDLFMLFIEERKKELIVLMINGYSSSQAKKYIYTDTLILSAIGIILGAIIGSFMYKWMISSISSDMSYFMHSFNISACLISCLISAAFVLVMCLISLKKIDKFELSDINK